MKKLEEENKNLQKKLAEADYMLQQEKAAHDRTREELEMCAR